MAWRDDGRTTHQRPMTSHRQRQQQQRTNRKEGGQASLHRWQCRGCRIVDLVGRRSMVVDRSGRHGVGSW